MNPRHRPFTICIGSLALSAILGGCAADRTQRANGAPAPIPPRAASPATAPNMAAGDGLQFRPRVSSSTPAPQPSPAGETAAAPVPPPPSPDSKRPDRTEQTQAPALPDILVEVFPHIRVNRAQRLVEFDGIVPIDAHHPESPLVFLEVVACTRGTKEHEALVMTDAKASEVHAALLLIGLEPGEPGSFRWENETLVPAPPSGDPVRVSIAYRNDEGVEVETSAAEWIRHAETGRLISAAADQSPSWVFAGSRFVTKGGQEMYDADGAGTLIGLATFGSETVAFTQMISPEASLQEPEWVAAGGVVPKFKTPVIVRLRAE